MKQLVEFLINSKSTGIISDPNFVDLGLSVLWAKCNIGAKKETDYGHYYQWGGLEPMDDKKCDWENAPFNNGNNNFDEKYFNSIKDKVCPNCILSNEYDVAYQTYEGNVHMPNKNNCEELIEKTQNEWIYNYNDSGINGRTFSGKNGNHIFIPAASLRHNCLNGHVGIEANIWSSCLCTGSNKQAWNLFIFNTRSRLDICLRSNGLPVRAVKEK